AIPDIPPNVATLLQLQLVERPQGLNALERWVSAMTPTGVATPAKLAVLSVAGGPALGPRLAVQLRPSVVLDAAVPDPQPAPAMPQPAPAMPQPAPAVPQPVAAGLARSPAGP